MTTCPRVGDRRQLDSAVGREEEEEGEAGSESGVDERRRRTTPESPRMSTLKNAFTMRLILVTRIDSVDARDSHTRVTGGKMAR